MEGSVFGIALQKSLELIRTIVINRHYRKVGVNLVGIMKVKLAFCNSNLRVKWLKTGSFPRHIPVLLIIGSTSFGVPACHKNNCWCEHNIRLCVLSDPSVKIHPLGTFLSVCMSCLAKLDHNESGKSKQIGRKPSICSWTCYRYRTLPLRQHAVYQGWKDKHPLLIPCELYPSVHLLEGYKFCERILARNDGLYSSGR